MHELSIAEEVYRTSRAAVADRAAGRLESVRVAVGELTAIEPDLLRFAWEAIVADGVDAGCAIEIEWHPARQSCPGCGARPERAAGSWLRLCPACGAALRVEGGHELDLLQVTFTTDDEEAANG